eukprot:560645-Rhodomonas_salina.5
MLTSTGRVGSAHGARAQVDHVQLDQRVQVNPRPSTLDPRPSTLTDPFNPQPSPLHPDPTRARSQEVAPGPPRRVRGRKQGRARCPAQGAGIHVADGACRGFWG